MILKKYKDLSENQKNWCDNFFTTSIFPLLTPLVVDPAHPFPFISNLSLNLAALIKDGEDSKNQFVRVCLLYTSPSPRDGTKSRMPSSA